MIYYLSTEIKTIALVNAMVYLAKKSPKRYSLSRPTKNFLVLEEKFGVGERLSKWAFYLREEKDGK